MLIFLAALFGFGSVAFGAYVDHALRDSLSPDALRSVMTAIRYHQLHAIAALAIGLTLWRGQATGALWFRLSGWAFLVGITLFSGGIYASVLLSQPSLTILAPFGGVTLMAAWLLAAIGGGASAWRR
ncbi:MAG: DUF423 domain-containing protein [Neomegalonema sp.]|nr:DUF423 domain-containing protein [Neomegalonema sp.]